MFNFDRKMPDFNPVAAGAKATLALPIGGTYREITLRYKTGGAKATSAEMIADIERVVLKINGTARIEVTGSYLVMLNNFYGNGFNDGELVIPLSRHWLRTMAGEENLAWGTKNVDTLTLEVQIASGATTPELVCDAFVTPEERDLGMIVEIHEFSHASSTTGKFEIPSLPKGNGSMVAIHLANANITSIEAKLNGTVFIDNDADLDAYHNALERMAGRSPQTGYVHLDAMLLNRLGDVWPLAGVQDFRINPTLSAAGSVPIIMETLNTPLGVAA